MPGANHHHPPPQLLTMRETSDKKVPLVNMSQDDPLYPSSKKQVTYVTINAIGTSCISLIKSKLMRKKLNNPQLLLRQP